MDATEPAPPDASGDDEDDSDTPWRDPRTWKTVRRKLQRQRAQEKLTITVHVTVDDGGASAEIGAPANQKRKKKTALPPSKQADAQTLIASMGHVSPATAAHTFASGSITGTLATKVDAAALRKFEPKWPFNLAAAKKNVRNSRNEFDNYQGRGGTPGENTHMDTAPKIMTSTTGNNGFAVAVDKKTSYCTVLVFKSKKEAYKVIIKHGESASKFKHELKYARPDNGTEISNVRCGMELAKLGQSMEVANTASPNEIHCAEKRIGMLISMAIALIDHACMPWQVWDYAVVHANTIWNMIVRQRACSSPWEQWRREKPILNGMDIFGERWLIKRDSSKSGEPQLVDKIGYFVGRSERQPGSRKFVVPKEGAHWEEITTANCTTLDSLRERRLTPPDEMLDLFKTESKAMFEERIDRMRVEHVPRNDTPQGMTPNQGEADKAKRIFDESESGDETNLDTYRPSDGEGSIVKISKLRQFPD